MARIRALRAGPDPQPNSPRAADGQQVHKLQKKKKRIENISAAQGSTRTESILRPTATHRGAPDKQLKLPGALRATATGPHTLPLRARRHPPRGKIGNLAFLVNDLIPLTIV